jgi:hypothetical protein
MDWFLSFDLFICFFISFLQFSFFLSNFLFILYIFFDNFPLRRIYPSGSDQMGSSPVARSLFLASSSLLSSSLIFTLLNLYLSSSLHREREGREGFSFHFSSLHFITSSLRLSSPLFITSLLFTPLHHFTSLRHSEAEREEHQSHRAHLTNRHGHGHDHG